MRVHGPPILDDSSNIFLFLTLPYPLSYFHKTTFTGTDISTLTTSLSQTHVYLLLERTIVQMKLACPQDFDGPLQPTNFI